MGDDRKDRAMVYKAVVQAVLMYGRKIWVVTDDIMKFLEGFHHRTARRISGMMAQRGDGGGWEWV